MVTADDANLLDVIDVSAIFEVVTEPSFIFVLVTALLEIFSVLISSSIAILPSSRFERACEALFAPVPPFTIGNTFNALVISTGNPAAIAKSCNSFTAA